MTSSAGKKLRRTDPARTAILVLGMHRSGTSAVTRLLNFLGADLSRNLMPGLKSDNELGFWESNDIVPLHEDFLAAAGSAWDDVSAFDAERIEPDAVAKFRSAVLDILDKDFSGSRIFAVKDPRICRFVPIWLEILDRFGAVPTAVIPIRHPLEVAESLKARNGFATEKSLLLWLRHCLEAERATRSIARSILTYDAVLETWREVASKVADDLDIEWPRSASRAAEEIDEFLSPSRRHHVFDLGELDQTPGVVDWVKRAFGSLLALAAEPSDEAARRELDSVYREFQEADAVFARVLTDERQRNRALASTLADREEEVLRLGGDVIWRNTEISRLKKIIDQREREVARLSRSLATAEERIDLILASTSWRITLPLRKTKPLLVWSLKLPRRAAKVIYWTLTLQLGKKLRQRHDIAIINQTRLFDGSFYLKANPELAKANVDPLRHYLERGSAEGRDPNPLFDTSYYLESNPDVAEENLNPLVHYIVSGAAEGRDPHPLFNAKYLARNMQTMGQ